MNPWDLSASDLLIWGIVLHLIADWPLQNDWMANNKMQRRASMGRYLAGVGEFKWYDRHPAAYVHSGIHGLLLALIFGWVAIPLAIAHLIIDCRWVVAKWSQLIGQTQPSGKEVIPRGHPFSFGGPVYGHEKFPFVMPVDIGLEVRFWTDQVFHIACVAIAAILVTL